MGLAHLSKNTAAEVLKAFGLIFMIVYSVYESCISLYIPVSLCILLYTTYIRPVFRSKDRHFSVFQPCVSTSNSGVDNEKSDARKALRLSDPINNARRVRIQVKSSTVLTCDK
uniref:Uncharacterized protein n=1 Tax=Solanum tuberosum TaxID=4113 RepID=M1DED6_SOLTU